ncbi:helix-turn-helix transcriptional regulator [Neobacillus muris]|uniref:helix-turn-helix transcriptional regulator n=1 Tax=Neobacillus muris TaxID=2941334 RepID=UPI002040775A|nr:helix-turn-helix domain-containing protein [Neobacillus muris]
MTREDIIIIVSEKLRLIRTEAGYTQEKMADIIGVSKKTLVQIEKGRVLANWPTVVSICALFRETETVQFLFGNEPLEVLETVARKEIDYRKTKTFGGRIWWRVLSRKNGYMLQQNILSKHFRILDKKNYRIFSSFDEKQSKQRFKEISAIEEV